MWKRCAIYFKEEKIFVPKSGKFFLTKDGVKLKFGLKRYEFKQDSLKSRRTDSTTNLSWSQLALYTRGEWQEYYLGESNP